jgi:hypothetical protein
MVENEKFSACSTHRELRDGQKVLLECHKGGTHLKNLDVSGRIVLNWILEQQDVCEDVNCIGLLRVGSNGGLM